jgi:hypothetical protein
MPFAQLPPLPPQFNSREIFADMDAVKLSEAAFLFVVYFHKAPRPCLDIERVRSAFHSLSVAFIRVSNSPDGRHAVAPMLSGLVERRLDNTGTRVVAGNVDSNHVPEGVSVLFSQESLRLIKTVQ